jgi:hypothetical protein
MTRGRQLRPRTAETTTSVTFNWSARTQNVDDSASTDLAGYNIFNGSGPRQYSTSMRVPTLPRSAVIDGLTADACLVFRH